MSLTVFPGAIDSFVAKQDAVDYYLADHINKLQDAILAVETKLATSTAATTLYGLNVGTATGATVGQIRASGAAMLNGVTTHQFAQQTIAELADHGKAQIGLAAEEVAIAFIIYANTLVGYTLNGAAHSASEIFDPLAGFTPTEDNDNTVNIYWDAGNARYELNNEMGWSASFYVFLFRIT